MKKGLKPIDKKDLVQMFILTFFAFMLLVILVNLITGGSQFIYVLIAGILIFIILASLFYPGYHKK